MMRDTSIHPYNETRDPSTSHPDDEIIASIDLSSNSITVTGNEFDHADVRLKIGFAGDKPTNLSDVKWGFDLQQLTQLSLVCESIIVCIHICLQ